MARAKGQWRRARRFVLERAMTETYPLVELESHAATQSLPVRKLIPAERTQGNPPIFIRAEELCDVSGYDGSEPSPEINLFELDDVTVVGRTEFIIKDGNALYPGIIDPALDAFMMEIENRGRVDPDAGKVHIFPRAAILQVDRAISLLGQCNGNYAHWITEVLTRFTLIEELPEFEGVPLLVDHPVHEKLLDSLDFLNVSRRRIIDVLPYQKVRVGRLIYMSPPSMTPPETREFFATGELAPPRPEQFHFSAQALAKLRERTLQDFLSPDAEESYDPPQEKNKRIFLRRQPVSTGNGRLLRNADAVEQVLEEMGFTGIDIADHSFEGQVMAVQDVEIVVSPIGAALANLVFREPGCIAVILTPHYEKATFYYFANLMTALGHDLIFVLGPQTRHGGASVYNRDFRISIRLLKQAVRKAIEVAHEKRTKVRPSIGIVQQEKVNVK